MRCGHTAEMDRPSAALMARPPVDGAFERLHHHCPAGRIQQATTQGWAGTWRQETLPETFKEVRAGVRHPGAVWGNT